VLLLPSNGISTVGTVLESFVEVVGIVEQAREKWKKI